MDGLSEKYLSYSTYHYAGNNPVLNYDIDGNYFVNQRSLFQAWDFQNNSRNRIADNNKNIEELQNLTVGSNLSKDSLNAINVGISALKNNNSELNESISEVYTLMASSQGYNIENLGAFASQGHTTYDFSTKTVNIAAPIGMGYGLLGHELKHAYQFDQGLMSLSSPSGFEMIPGVGSIGIDLVDEWVAYRRQNAIETNSSPYKSYNDLDKDVNGPYAKHPRAPSSVSQHAMIQQYLNSNGSQEDKKRWFNNLAKRGQQAFRINGKTYDGN